MELSELSILYHSSEEKINELYELSYIYSKYEILYIGYMPNYMLKKKDIETIGGLPNNIKFIKYIDEYIFTELCKLSKIIINFENIELDYKYLYIILLLKKQLLIKDDLYYINYLVDNKNVYTFDNKDELILKLKKILDDRIMNLTDNAYELISEYKGNELSKKFISYLNKM